MSKALAGIEQLNSGLSGAEIEGILFIIGNTAGLTNSELIRQTGLPKETLKVFKSSISHYLDNGESETISLNPEGVEFYKKISPKPYKWTLVDFCSTGVESQIAEIRASLNAQAKRTFDQFFATPQTSVSKAVIANEKGMISEKRIALMGDDDLLSLTIPLINPTYLDITVFDIDSELLSCIEQKAAELGFKNIKTVKYDARQDLRNQFINSFDVVITDPPYTKAGVLLFLSRAIELLSTTPNSSLNERIFFYYGNSPKTPEKWLKIQEIITKLGLVIEDKIEKFARYNGAESIGSASSLYILKPTPFTSKLPRRAPISQIYTFENKKEEAFPYVDHVVIKAKKISNKTLGSRKNLLNLLNKFCIMHKLKVVDTKITSFKNQGFTFTFVLANSNLVVHTWPEYSALHLDLITCSPIYNKENLALSFSELFSTNDIEISFVE